MLVYMRHDDTEAARNHPVAYSKKETADALGVSVRTVERMIAEGELHALHLRRRVVIPVAELERVLGKAS